MPKYTHEEWIAEAVRRFGSDKMDWKFVCPSCGCVWSVRDWKDAGAKESSVASSCVGRAKGSNREIGHDDGQPCNYANFGLFCLDPNLVVMPDGKVMTSFGFLETPEELDEIWATLAEDERQALVSHVVAKPDRSTRAMFERLVARKLVHKRARSKKGPAYERRSLGTRLVEHIRQRISTPQPQQESHV